MLIVQKWGEKFCQNFRKIEQKLFLFRTTVNIEKLLNSFIVIGLKVDTRRRRRLPKRRVRCWI